MKRKKTQKKTYENIIRRDILNKIAFFQHTGLTGFFYKWCFDHFDEHKTFPTEEQQESFFENKDEILDRIYIDESLASPKGKMLYHILADLHDILFESTEQIDITNINSLETIGGYCFLYERSLGLYLLSKEKITKVDFEVILVFQNLEKQLHSVLWCAITYWLYKKNVSHKCRQSALAKTRKKADKVESVREMLERNGNKVTPRLVKDVKDNYGVCKKTAMTYIREAQEKVKSDKK